MTDKVNRISFDTIIFALIFGLLPIDMINGYLLREVGVTSIISIAQLYKLFIIGALFMRINSTEKVIIISLFGLLLLPTAFQVASSFDVKLLFIDSVMVIKWLSSVLAFFYFRIIFIHKAHLLKWVYRWMLFSFLILVLNIFLRLFGLGFPMYSMDALEIGSRGYFFAGNEVSVVLLILSSFLMYWYQFYNKKMLFIIIGMLAILTGLFMTSKTAIFGTFLTFFYFLIFNPNRKGISISNIVSFLLSVFILLPIGFYFIVKYLKTSDVMERFSFFWNELDIYTFILSNRNTYFFDFIEIFKKEYNIIEMFIGLGITNYELINPNDIIEIDFLDIFFSYGIIGCSLFLFYISFLLIQSKIKSLNRKTYLFSSYSKYIVILLIALSFLSGHVFNSGMAAIYMGCVFSLMYYKSNYEN